jgi:predicted NBD/HSP70 family sugar kinase
VLHERPQATGLLGHFLSHLLAGHATNARSSRRSRSRTASVSALETALKIKETDSLLAHEYSAADLRLGRELARLAAAGDPIAEANWSQAIDPRTLAIANYAAPLDPERVVSGGGMAVARRSAVQAAVGLPARGRSETRTRARAEDPRATAALVLVGVAAMRTLGPRLYRIVRSLRMVEVCQ